MITWSDAIGMTSARPFPSVDAGQSAIFSLCYRDGAWNLKGHEMFKKIVVGIDGSDTSETAMRVACDLSEKYEAELHFVHTPQPQTVAFALGAVASYHLVSTMPSHSEVMEGGEKILDKGRAIASDCNQTITQTYMEVGDPTHLIVECAETIGSDLIVTGRRGLGSLGALVQGSTSSSINKLAKCACLSVA